MRELKNLIGVIFTILLLTVLFLYLADHDFYYVYTYLSSSAEKKHITVIYAASIIALTFIIACAAWSQLRGILKTGQADFLLRIDQRFGDQYIIEARVIIHEFYMESRDKNINFTERQHCDYIADKIYSLGEDTKNKKSMKQYVCLLNFLDFLETVSFFSQKDYISANEINDLMNQSLVFFYTIFEKRINERRRKYDDKTFYIHFENLVSQIKKQKNYCPCFFCKFAKFLCSI